MWVRIAAHFPVAFSPLNLAYYRVHPANISSRSFNKASNIRDINYVINEINKFVPVSDRKRIANLSKKNFSIYFARLSHKIYHEYERPKDGLYQAVFALMMHSNFETFKYSIKLIIKYLFGYSYIKSFLKR